MNRKSLIFMCAVHTTPDKIAQKLKFLWIFICCVLHNTQLKIAYEPKPKTMERKMN